MPKVSVVVPAYNARKYLAECLESVCAQTFTGWDLIVVDDGSVDDTAAIVRPYCERDPRIRLHIQENGGVASARNRGLALADPQTEYFLFLDQDDFLHADALETPLGALEGTDSAVRRPPSTVCRRRWTSAAGLCRRMFLKRSGTRA